MGGRVLSFRGEWAYNLGCSIGLIEGRQEGIEESIKEGRLEMLANLVSEGALGAEAAAKIAHDEFEIPYEDFWKSLYSRNADDRRLQE